MQNNTAFKAIHALLQPLGSCNIAIGYTLETKKGSRLLNTSCIAWKRCRECIGSKCKLCKQTEDTCKKLTNPQLSSGFLPNRGWLPWFSPSQAGWLRRGFHPVQGEFVVFTHGEFVVFTPMSMMPLFRVRYCGAPEYTARASHPNVSQAAGERWTCVRICAEGDESERWVACGGHRSPSQCPAPKIDPQAY